MNLSDVANNWQFTESWTSISSTTAQVVKQNGRRFGLIFHIPNTAVVYLSTRPDLAQNRGIQVQANTQPVEFNFRDHGQLVQSNWYAVTPGIGMFLTVIEVLYIDNFSYSSAVEQP